MKKLVSLALILSDAVIVAAVAYLAFMLRFEGKLDSQYLALVKHDLPMIIAIQFGTFYLFGLYNRMWQYAGIGELIAIAAAVSFSAVLIVVLTMTFDQPYPRSIHIISWFLNILLIGCSRLGARIIKQMKYIPEHGQSRVLIVGAGHTGSLVAREINQYHLQAKRIVGFVDDDQDKQGRMLLGYKVLGKRRDLQRLVDQYQVDELIIAIAALDGEPFHRMIQECRQTGRRVRIVPGLDELVNGKPTVEQLREVNLEDLLRREPVQPDLKQLAGYLQGKRVLVTGAGGSIGSELCRQIIRLQPAGLILLGRGENSIYEIEQELRADYPNINIEPVIADVRNQRRINAVFARTKPEVVFHAAAHKHVPLMELQPEEAVQNNIFGTRNVAEAAHASGTAIFVMISTDKAVNPSSVMGTTKRIAEQIIQSINPVSQTKFVAVRFGNVLGSRGSVVPLFKKQIAGGGPVTVTHPEMKRYFMTIPEAVQLVLQAGAMARGGEVFALDMGQPVKIYDLACTLIELAGLRPNKDIEIKFSGLRPGEKLFEELFSAEEGTSATSHGQIFRAKLQTVDLHKLERGLALLQQCRFPHEIRYALQELVPTYSGYQAEVAVSEEPPIGASRGGICELAAAQT
jgi:FlaA1/EpsC-like NDP-sugar epimerase